MSSQRRHARWDKRLLWERLAVLLLGIYLTTTAIASCTRGRLLYSNYLRLPTFAPLTLAVGVLLIAIAIVAWEWGRKSL